MSASLDGIKYWTGKLLEAVDRNQYNCYCEDAGPDAMYIDTDWLRAVALQIEYLAKHPELVEYEANLNRYAEVEDGTFNDR